MQITQFFIGEALAEYVNHENLIRLREYAGREFKGKTDVDKATLPLAIPVNTSTQFVQGVTINIRPLSNLI